MFGAVLTGYHDELSFRRPFRFSSLQFSNPCCPAGGDPRASPPTCGFPKERAASLAPPSLRPALVGCVVPILVRLAAMSADGSARHGPPLAPQSFRLALDQGIAPVVLQMVVPYIKGIPSYLARALRGDCRLIRRPEKNTRRERGLCLGRIPML